MAKNAFCAEAGGKSQLFWLMAAIAAAAVVGTLGNLMPDGTRELISSALLSPVGKGFQGLMSTFAGIMVFLTVAGSIYNAGDISTLGRIGKVLPAALLSFTTASGMASYTVGTDICKKRLGIQSGLVDFCYPIGIVMYMPSVALFYVLVPMYVADMYHVEAQLPWFILCILLATFLSIAVPPIPGNGITCISIILLQLSIPGEGMLFAVALNAVLDYVMSGFNILDLQLELVLEARQLDMLDEAALKTADD